MFELKPISDEAIARSLAKVERYRLLNEPREAESICRDILEANPDNQEALVGLLLALTDQFGRQANVRPDRARDLLHRLKDEYARTYYAGVIAERWGKARLHAGDPGHVAYEWIAEAMDYYEQAEKISPAGNDDAILRWNTCARMMQSDPRVRPRADDEPLEHGFLDHVPH